MRLGRQYIQYICISCVTIQVAVDEMMYCKLVSTIQKKRVLKGMEEQNKCMFSVQISHEFSRLFNLHLGNSMPTDTLFCRPIPDFDKIWQAWGSTEETNPHQVSAHFNHF